MSKQQQHRFLDNIDRDTDRMEDLLASMRASSLAEQCATVGTSNLNQIVDEIRERFSPLVITAQNGNLELPVHQDTLKIILTHMLENSQQHQAKEVILAASSEDGMRCLTITDDGSGISDGNRDKILNPFFTTRRDDGGTGMGLNIVKSVIRAVGGDLAHESCHSGARFRIKF